MNFVLAKNNPRARGLHLRGVNAGAVVRLHGGLSYGSSTNKGRWSCYGCSLACGRFNLVGRLRGGESSVICDDFDGEEKEEGRDEEEKEEENSGREREEEDCQSQMGTSTEEELREDTQEAPADGSRSEDGAFEEGVATVMQEAKQKKTSARPARRAKTRAMQKNTEELNTMRFAEIEADVGDEEEDDEDFLSGQGSDEGFVAPASDIEEDRGLPPPLDLVKGGPATSGRRKQFEELLRKYEPSSEPEENAWTGGKKRREPPSDEGMCFYIRTTNMPLFLA